MSAPTFQLSLLGRFELSGPNGPIDLTSKKLAALLAFLACTAPKPHGRNELMTLLWGSHFDAQARQNLRQALHRLRRVLGEDALITNDESVSLQPGVVACDATRFEALLANGGRDALREAIDLYRGRLLAEIAISEEAWTEWLDVERQRLDGLALDAMVKLAEQERQLGNHEQALDAANRAIALSNLREDAHRLIMRVLVAGGRRADALTERIVSAIEPTVRAVEIERALAKPTGSLSTYDCYLRALPYYYSQTREGLAQAEDLLRRAIELDPKYAEALGMFADVTTSRIANGWHGSRKREIEEACEATARALADGPSNSTCIAAAAYAFAVLARRFVEAQQLAERAIDVHPNSTFVRNRAGAVYANSGESDKAIEQISMALRMNPLDNITSTFTFTVAAVAHLFARRFGDCLHWARRATAITPQARIPQWCAAAALGHLGRLEEARSEIDKILALHPNATLSRARIASFRHGWMYELYLDGLRKAGLPEG